jgi:hypothetical protein
MPLAILIAIQVNNNSEGKREKFCGLPTSRNAAKKARKRDPSTALRGCQQRSEENARVTPLRMTDG